MNKYKEFANAIKKYNKIVYFTGAGVSVDSGVSDFRSKDGIQ